ncbi:DUF5681 domain-containing protein [Shinella sp. S4-D37]|uniref:DUF5681 domain-containing protein n=1 Tax=Shinella sp. S4-D37 TaxID=3161999 RepID=UPI003466DAA5
MAKKREITDEHRERLKRQGFQKGKSGNPKGRPLEDDALKARIRQKLPELIDRLEDIAYNGKNEASVVKAIEAMMSYVLAKATTKHEHKHEHDLTGFDDFLLKANRRHQMLEGEVIDAIEIKPEANTDA